MKSFVRPLVLTLLLAAPAWCDETVNGVVVIGNVVAPTPPSNVVTVPAGRFVPVYPADGSPSYLAPNAAFHVFVVKPGSVYFGVKYDEPDGAEQTGYSWPDVKTPVCVLQTKQLPGRYSIQFVKNGPAETGPVPNGSPLVLEVVGPRPLPEPPTPPTPPTPPAPAGIAAATQAAYAADPSPTKAADKAALAGVYRNAAISVGAVATANDLHNFLKDAADKRVGAQKLKTVRAVLGNEIGKLVPDTPAAKLTSEQVFAVSGLLNNFAAILDAIP